mgnify:CR=1 FL=1
MIEKPSPNDVGSDNPLTSPETNAYPDTTQLIAGNRESIAHNWLLAQAKRTAPGEWPGNTAPMLASVWNRSETTASPEIRPKALLLVGRSGFIPSCNILALVHQFPDLVVWHANTLAAPLSDTVSPPAVMLVDEAYLATLTTAEEALMEVAGDRIVAVIDEAVPARYTTVNRLLSQNLIRGVLPMNLRLEVWLLAVNLFVMGGEFVPASLLNSQLRAAKKKEVRESSLTSVKADIGSLTERELQVLEMVSAGSSNRTIALRFSLSEHTIKVHVHNIIRKLNASNRTAAAATYLEAIRAAAGPAKVSGKAIHGVPA